MGPKRGDRRDFAARAKGRRRFGNGSNGGLRAWDEPCGRALYDAWRAVRGGDAKAVEEISRGDARLFERDYDDGFAGGSSAGSDRNAGTKLRADRRAAAAIGGMLTAFLIDSFIPEAGKGENGAMFRVGIFSMLALLLHNLPEGIAVFVGGCADLRIGLSLSIAIALHNIPEGISVALPIAASTGRRSQGVIAATLSGLSEPAGAVLAYLFLAPLFGDVLLATIFALVAGLMLYVVFDELLPAALSERRPGWALAGILAGILVMLLSIAIV